MQRWFGLLLCVGLLSAGICAQDRPVVLCRGGQARAVVVLPPGPLPVVRVAAKELVEHVRLICGVELPLVELAEDRPLASVAEGRVSILLGDSRWVRGRGIDCGKLPPEGFVIRVGQDAVVVAGHDGATYGDNYRFATEPAGTLYGVYRLLEWLGVRWVYPGDEGRTYPQSPGELSLAAREETDAPHFAYRHTQYAEFLWGRRICAGGDRDIWSTRHTCSLDLQKNYRATHPEWFLPNADGGPGAQADLTNPEVVRVVAEMAARRFDTVKQTGLKYYIVIPLDGRAKPADDARSRWVCQAVTSVAERVRQSHSEGRVVYCAYNDYKRPPPDLERLPENVVVLIAQSRAALLDGAAREKSYALVREWQVRRPEAIYFCRYTGARMGMVPALIPHVVAQDLRRLKQMSNAGPTPIRGEMNFGGVKADSPYSWWEHVNEYVTAKLLWNPDRDVDAVLDDLCQHQFGPAAQPMRELLAECERAYASVAERHVFTPRTIRLLEDHMASARERTRNDPEHARRVAFVDRGLEPLRRMRAKQEDATSLPGDPDAGLVLRLGFEEGESLPGTLRNTSWAPGVVGRGLRLSRPDSCLHLEPVDLKDCDYSYEIWMKPERCEQGDQYLFGPDMWERQTLKIEYGLPTDAGQSGRLVLKHRRWQGGKNIELVSAPLEFRPGQWYHVVGTFSRANGMGLYLNGRLVGLNMALTEPSEMSLRYLGATGDGRTQNPDDTSDAFVGVIDEAAIYRRELSLSEVRQRHERQRPQAALPKGER